MSGHVYHVYKLLGYLRHRERTIRPALIDNNFSEVSKHRQSYKKTLPKH